MRIGLFFGTYNPIHVGHLVIANYMADYTDLDQVWLVVSPQNPLKKKQHMLADHHRLAMVRVAIEDNNKLKASNIEFGLSTPSYTIHTLAHLEDQFPQHTFALIMGEDNLRNFHKWKSHELILERYPLYVYPRVITADETVGDAPIPEVDGHPNVHRVDAPVMRISASFIRQAIRDKKDVQYLLTEPVFRYATEMHFYEK